MILSTARGRALLAANVLIAFGLVSAVVQFAGQVFGMKFSHPGLITGASLGLCVVWGFVRSYPRERIERQFVHPDLTVVIKVGDLLEEQAHLVVGFSDTFDTDSDADEVINRASLQGQLLARVYGGDRARLDGELSKALASVTPACVEARTAKQRGKLKRYPIGTVALIGPPDRRVYAVAYSRMGNDLTAHSSLNDLWTSLDRLWKSIAASGQLGRVAIPVMGAELARIYALDRENLLKVIILSFMARSRLEPVCRELVVVIRPQDADKVDLLEMRAFLAAL
ncbi:macro domain-containing protein [Nonomuraea sp. NPDC050328]|uniref:macro domain-containing protein n=1 Tax=Nonomuraea sp. NPDC050328 TaxID=3364361 RepID=UPI00378A0E56